ncbi:class I SAM-dependent methyltransferase [Novosphingobium kaempferiae]|uniref:class I SAM-dependent methyltransferase n=1 Tax=Novosphingobium kaempferiae TaxID=2896849 RepID=UPI001E2E99CF|nr:class I SAM-dependent methyltransferase [Novosphingobium kaempferiae]
MSHPMMPETTHDEHVEQLFVRDFKVWLGEGVGAQMRGVAENVAEVSGSERMSEVRRDLMQNEVFRSWIGYRRLSQEMMWDAVGRSIDRQIDTLQSRARIAEPKGSVTLDPDFTPPPYIAALDVHMMPGGYHHDQGQGDVRQGALIDRGGAVYMLGRNGGLMNDVRGHTTVQHLWELYPDLEPKRILDLGCAVGASTVAVASHFPDAEVVAVDVGGAMLRYAHARAEHLGERVHFVQADAEKTPFEDESFDVVYSCVLLHETSNAAARNIFRECHRLLRPGGVMIHNEVPGRTDELGVWGNIQGDFEALYNNEPFWRGMQNMDFAQITREAGFAEATIGYQLAAPKPSRRAPAGFSTESSGPFRSWFMISARK